MLIIIAILFGIIQGITEWLPISSTGHLIIFNSLIRNLLNIENTMRKEFFDFFLVMIQFSSILAVILFFFKELNPISKDKSLEEKKNTFMLWFKVVIACIPVALVGLILEDMVDNNFVIAGMLILFGIAFIIVENINKHKKFRINDVSEITFRVALIIGIFQLLALIPGTSRSGVTIIGAMILGVNRASSAKFSFFLSIPVMFGASLLNGIRFFSSYTINTNEMLYLIVGGLTSFAISIFVIRFLLNFIRKYDFKIFGYYRIVLGIFLIGIYFVF